MKRMVKNGNQLDVKPNGDLGIKGNAQVGGRLQVKSSIISTGEIRGGDISGTKFLLGTEEMPLVKANPAGDAAGTLEKIKIGNVAYKIGGGGSNDRELTLIFPYPSTDSTAGKKAYVDDETYNNINNKYYDTIKLYYNDGNPLAVLHALNKNDFTINGTNQYACIAYRGNTSYQSTWYGEYGTTFLFCYIKLASDSTGKYISLSQVSGIDIPILSQTKLDALYKLADKPTQDGTYVLKATVSGGAVTYTWVAQ